MKKTISTFLFMALFSLVFGQIEDNTQSTIYTHTEFASKTWSGSHGMLFNAYMSPSQVNGPLSTTGNTKYYNNVGNYGGGAAAVMFFGNGGTMDFLISPTSTGKNQNVVWGTPKMRILRNGNVGIGTSGPAEKLDVNGTIMGNYVRVNAQNGSTEGGEIRLDGAASYNDWRIDNYAGKFRLHHSGASYLNMKSNGFMGLGTGNPTAKLQVHNGDIYASNGKVITKHASSSNQWQMVAKSNGGFEIRKYDGSNLGFFQIDSDGSVTLGIPGAGHHFMGEVCIDADGSQCPDYVFEDDYKLKTIEELEAFIQENKHLPGVVSAKTVTERGTISLVETNYALLEKVEELTLYTIQQHKTLQEQQARIEALEAAILKKQD